MSSVAHSVSFVLLPIAGMPSAEDFLLAWSGITNGALPPVQKEWGSDTAALELDGTVSIVTLAPAPVPNGEAEEAVSRSLSSMRASGFSPAPHIAHLIVVSSSNTATPVGRLSHHARVVAALAQAGSATGVYEGGAQATHDPEFYVDVVSNAPDPPLMVWNGVSIAKTGRAIEVLTLGMEQLDLPNLLVVAPADQGDDALALAFDLLSYLVSRETPIPAGETVGRTAAEKLVVTYVPSPVDPAARVLRVELPRPKRKWWSLSAN